MGEGMIYQSHVRSMEIFEGFPDVFMKIIACTRLMP
jgi:hypothetical protein